MPRPIPWKPPPPVPKQRKKLREKDEYVYGIGQRRLEKPPDQEKLTEIELKKEIVRSLTTFDSLKLRNTAIWNYKDRVFNNSVDPFPSHFLLTLNSELISKDGQLIAEVKESGAKLMEDDSDNEVAEGNERPPARQPNPPKVIEKKQLSFTTGGPEESKKLSVEAKEAPAQEIQKEEEEEDDEFGGGDGPTKKAIRLINQFNFQERASQTSDNKQRSHGNNTEQVSQSEYKDTCNLHIIYDSYKNDPNRPKAGDRESGGGGGGGGGFGGEEEEGGAAAEKKPVITKKDKDTKLAEKKVKMRKQSVVEGQAATEVAYHKAIDSLTYLERIVAVNNDEDILHDFKYFDDVSDAYRDEGEGTVIPLWRFLYDKSRKKHVTCISWSESVPDCFAASFGSFSFMHPVQTGLIVVYSLRNPLFPEHICHRGMGVLCCHIHNQRNSLICAGLADGNVIALNIGKQVHNESHTDVYENQPIECKHSAPLWSCKWGLDDMDGNPTFYSAGMDGKVIRWAIGVHDQDGNGGLVGVEVYNLILPQPAVDGPDGTCYKLFGCARCLTFHPTENMTLLVGTAEGKIFITSPIYGDKIMKIFDAHFLPVSGIQWNKFHSDVFLSSSEDWTVKVWDRRDSAPLFVFETGVPELDVAWAPYSSSVFASITLEGKLLVFDLDVCREKPICSQQVATKKKIHPHRIGFNPHHPIIIIGDDRGSLLTVKLSPNLRLMAKSPEGIPLTGDKRDKFENDKLSRLIQLVRDPPLLTHTKPEDYPIVTNLAEMPGQLSQMYG